MRIAIVSDIHGNRTALEAVLGDLRETSPDLILHGGDLADGGARPAEVVDRIRDLGWDGVAGNADEMLWKPEALAILTPGPVLDAVADIAMSTREALGDERLAWLRTLPLVQVRESLTVLHASPKSLWRAPEFGAEDSVLEQVFGSLGTTVVVYGHIHRPYVRRLGALTIANAGSVSLSYSGDTRAVYLLVDGETATIRFVEYDVNREIKALLSSNIPHAEWIAAMLESASFQMP